VVEDVRKMRGLNCDSDNFLVKTTIKQKLIRTQNKAVKQKKWNQSNLQHPVKLKRYRTCLYKKLIGKKVQQDVEEERTNVKETVTESANEVIQTQNISTKNEWWDESCKLIMA
jgi:2C-methyl-D-erythritol 2,4-cyclodiphosphate synthase